MRQAVPRFLLFAAVGAGLGLAPPWVRSAEAVDSDVRTVLIGGLYGILGGTALGLASYPLHRNVKSIFVGSSIGLYLGFAVGIYHVWNREEPGNPLSLHYFRVNEEESAKLDQGVAASYRLVSF